MAPTLAYWNIRGLAQPIRLLLAYTETEYEEKYYECGPAPDYDKSCWFDIKYTLGLAFPNLPYYIDGDMKLTQSGAIMRYIARQHGLCGETEEEKMRVDMLECEVSDFRSGFTRMCYSAEFENLKAKYLENLPKKLKEFSDFLGSHKWFAGSNITFVDFIMYEMLDQHLLLDPECLKDFGNLKEFHKNFEELESIKKYISSDKFLKYPLNNKMAKFGGAK